MNRSRLIRLALACSAAGLRRSSSASISIRASDEIAPYCSRDRGKAGSRRGLSSGPISITAVFSRNFMPSLPQAMRYYHPMSTIDPVHVIGGGLAGSEAAWQLSRAGVPVVLHEMRPVRMTEAHLTAGLAELVCSNSLRSDDWQANAVGLLHAE